MTTKTLRFLIGTALLMLGGAAVGDSAEPAKVKTERIPQFENDEVKVWKSVVLPDTPLPLHRHEHPRVIIALVGGTMKVVQQDGTQEVHPWRSGTAYWLPANPPGTLHSDVNAGDKPIEVMVVELKRAQ